MVERGILTNEPVPAKIAAFFGRGNEILRATRQLNVTPTGMEVFDIFLLVTTRRPSTQENSGHWTVFVPPSPHDYISAVPYALSIGEDHVAYMTALNRWRNPQYK